MELELSCSMLDICWHTYKDYLEFKCHEQRGNRSPFSAKHSVDIWYWRNCYRCFRRGRCCCWSTLITLFSGFEEIGRKSFKIPDSQQLRRYREGIDATRDDNNFNDYESDMPNHIPPRNKRRKSISRKSDAKQFSCDRMCDDIFLFIIKCFMTHENSTLAEHFSFQ